MEHKKIISILLVSLLCTSPLFALTYSPIATQKATSNIELASENANVKQNQNYKVGGTIKTYMGDTANTLNPLNIISVYDDEVIVALFDSLVDRNPYIPTGLTNETGIMARSFNYSRIDASYESGSDPVLTRRNGTAINDSTVSKWTVELRHGYTWHDGADITADDLVFTYQFDKWIINKASSESIGDFMPMMGYYTVEKVDKYTVNIYSGSTGFERKRYPLYLTPWPKHIYGKASTWKDGAAGTFDVDNSWVQDWEVTAQRIVNYVPTSYEDPILTGSGPWVLDYADAQAPEDIRTFLFERNEYYWWSPYNDQGEIMESRRYRPEYFNNPAEYNTTIWPSCQGQVNTGYMYGPYADRLKLRVILKESFEWQAFKTGNIDFAVGSSVTQHSKEIEEMELPTIENPEWGLGSIHFQCNKTYFTRHAKFRRAIDWAVDKNEIINEVVNGYGIPLDDPLTEEPYGPWNWETPANRFSASPGKARQMITSLDKVYEDTNDDGLLEYQNGSNIRPLEMLYRSGSPQSEQEARLLETQIEAAGVPVELIKVTWDELIEAITTGGFQTALHGWSVGGLPTWFIIWACEVAAWSMAEYHWVNRSYTEAFTAMATAENIQDAIPNAKVCEQILYEQVPAAHLWRDLVVSSYRSDKWQGVIPGVAGSVLNSYSYRFMALKPEAKKEGALGFSRKHKAQVSGEVTLGTKFEYETSRNARAKNVSKLNITFSGAQIDEGELEPVTVNLLSAGNASQEDDMYYFFSFNWQYTLDTTELSNGPHHISLLIYGLLLGDPITLHLIINVQNPVPLSQQMLPMLAISSVVGLIIGAAVVFAVMRRKKPPEE